jgi:hypothetical protein
MGRGLLFALILEASTLTACEGVHFEPGDAGPSGIQGGNETDAASTLAPQGPGDASFVYAPLTMGDTWTALYTDYFGTPQSLADGGQSGGRASCSAVAGMCHGASGDTGAELSGFVCPGADADGGKDDCYGSMSSGLLSPDEPFTVDTLSTVIRSVDNTGGLMPKAPPAGYPVAYTFTAFDLQRLSDWVDAGFPNN